MVPSSSYFSSQKFGSHLYASWYLPSFPYSDQVLEISPQVTKSLKYLPNPPSCMACARIWVQALSFPNRMNSSSPLKLYNPKSPLAWNTGHQVAVNSAAMDSIGRSVSSICNLLPCPFCPQELVKVSFIFLIIHEDVISARLYWNLSYDTSGSSQFWLCLKHWI